ncbi:ligase-associated DNA damage response exonuclease [bacterium]|nr:ligase-associated DNA damage response exonuclease [bacterium]
MAALLEMTDAGLYCAVGDFFVDPWKPVDRAVVTHAHSDHARRDCGRYLAAVEGEGVLRTRLGAGAQIRTLPFGEALTINGVQVSFHPAGHILGSAQVRVEHNGEVWVVSGDYKTEPDPTCTPFELVTCHTFITEATFGLPIYRWPRREDVFAQINEWWRANQAAGICSVLYGYALGKAQRLLAGVDRTIGPIFTHGAVERLNADYRAAGIDLPETVNALDAPTGTTWPQALVVAPPSADGTPWLRRFGDLSTAFASGWMQVRGQRRRRSLDRGFVLSDHVDWPALIQTIQTTGAERVLVTHGYVPVVVRYLREQGIDAYALATHFAGEVDTGDDEDA